MNQHDFKHYRFHRTDPTGRHSPLHIPRETEPVWLLYLGGALMGVVIALLIYWGI